MRRLPEQPYEVIDRSRPLEFTWNREQMTGYAGDTIASALAASGVRVLSRSLKHRRPRGILTADYWDPSAMLQVGAEPNVRAAHRQLAQHMAVSSQTGWPSVSHDFVSVVGLVTRFLGPGFYYKTFMRPRSLWPLYERTLAGFGTGGRIAIDGESRRGSHRYLHPDVLVVGGGPAGMMSAVAAADEGAEVLLVEQEVRLGGHLAWGGDQDQALLADLVGEVRSRPTIEVLEDTTAFGRYDDNWVAAVQRSHPAHDELLVKARAKVLVVAAGLIERPYVFDGNDRPGVLLGGGARRLANLFAVKPGERAVVLVADRSGDAVVRDLDRAGVELVAVVDARQGRTVVAAEGRRRDRLDAVRLSGGERVRADLLVTSVGWTAPTSLLNMAGCVPEYDAEAGRFFPGQLPSSVLVTGGLAGDGSTETVLDHARGTGVLAARRAAVTAHRLQMATARSRPVDQPPDAPEDRREPLPKEVRPEMFRSSTHGIVDFSEDVSSKDLIAAAAEGYDSIELLKRYTTATMGPQQGKLETVNMVAVLADFRGEPIGDVGTTVWRPPYAPVSFAALAGADHQPMRRSALQPWHDTHGATSIRVGLWQRPEHYGDPQAEALHVRSRVGVIDVTPLGKFDLRGPEVLELLDILYVNNWSSLGVGGVRYGVMCNDEGVILDDGVVGRLGAERYLMTTTSSGATTVGEWVESWVQDRGLDVRVTPVTAAYTSINVAGPHSRELLARLTDVDLDPQAFPYMRVREGHVAGIPDCVVWRIGFTGELSYEIHVPAGYGLHVWEQLLEAGADLDVKPFGLEAQRILRLEKGHFIVGQDTDGLTKVPSNGLGALVKLAKPDFIGKPELSWALADEPTSLLVGIQTEDQSIVPAEGVLIVDQTSSEIVGRITSARFSPILGRSVCLGHVSPDLAMAGTALSILLEDGKLAAATVTPAPAHFDPAGERLHG